MEAFTAWVFAVLMAISPYREKSLTYARYAHEPEDEQKARYSSIAKDLAEVVQEEEPLFKGKNGRVQTAALVMSMAFFESGLKKEVDFGTGKWGRGDFGRSWCLMQINLGKGQVSWGTTEMKTWSGQDLVNDRKKCFKVGITALRLSLGACQGKAGGDKLSSYTTGTCRDNEPTGRSRWNYAWRLLSRFTPPAAAPLASPPPP